MAPGSPEGETTTRLKDPLVCAPEMDALPERHPNFVFPPDTEAVPVSICIGVAVIVVLFTALTFKFGTIVVLDTESGAVPVVTVLTSWNAFAVPEMARLADCVDVPLAIQPLGSTPPSSSELLAVVAVVADHVGV